MRTRKGLTHLAGYLLPFLLVFGQLLVTRPALAQDAVTEEPAVSAASIEGVTVVDPIAMDPNRKYVDLFAPAVSAAQADYCEDGDLISRTRGELTSPGQLVIHIASCAEGFGAVHVWMEDAVLGGNTLSYVHYPVEDMTTIAGTDLSFDIPQGVTNIYFHIWNAEGGNIAFMALDVTVVGPPPVPWWEQPFKLFAATISTEENLTAAGVDTPPVTCEDLLIPVSHTTSSITGQYGHCEPGMGVITIEVWMGDTLMSGDKIAQWEMNPDTDEGKTFTLDVPLSGVVRFYSVQAYRPWWDGEPGRQQVDAYFGRLPAGLTVPAPPWVTYPHMVFMTSVLGNEIVAAASEK